MMKSVSRLPSDLVVVVGIVFLTNFVILISATRENPILIPLGLLFLLFIPGYAFVAALFPGAQNRPSESEEVESALAETGPLSVESEESSGIDGIERIALSFGLSIAISSLIGLGVSFTPWGITQVSVLVTLSVFTLVSVVVAMRRRLALPDRKRFRVSQNELLKGVLDESLQQMSPGERVVNFLLVLGVVIAVVSVGWAVVAPQPGESFTEFYILSGSEDNELGAEGYPTEYSVGEPGELVVGVTNQEHQRIEYYVVIRLQEVEFANNSTTSVRSQQLNTFQTVLSHNETWQKRHNVTPTFTGTRLRLQYLLYQDDVPSNPRAASAYRETHLWINVTSSG